MFGLFCPSVLLGAVLLEAKADAQLDSFIAARTVRAESGAVCSDGLWGKQLLNSRAQASSDSNPRKGASLIACSGRSVSRSRVLGCNPPIASDSPVALTCSHLKCNVGWSRHPNYFGEWLFWFGLWLSGGAEVSHWMR